MIAALGGRLQVRVQLLELAQGLGVAVLDRARRELPGQQGLAGERVPDIVAGQRDHDVTPPGLQLDQAFGAQHQQALAHRGGADAQALRHRLGTDEVPAVQLAGDDQVAEIGRGLGAELGAVTAVLARPARGRPVRERIGAVGRLGRFAHRVEPLRTGMGG